MTANARKHPIAYISTRRQVRVVEASGKNRALTGGDTPMLLGGWQFDESPGSYSWPTWSPDGRQLACFRLPDTSRFMGAGASARVVVTDVYGIASAEVADLDDRLPIYLHWAPDGKHIAVLTQKSGQEDDRLQLSVTRPDLVDNEHPLATGSPLFFTWVGSNRVAAFVGTGTTSGSRLAMFDPRGRASTIVLPGTPGNFCAPIPIDEDVVYVVHRRGHTAVVVGSPDSPELRELEQVEGLVALVASPDGRTLARALAPNGDGTPYRGLALLDAHTGEVRALQDEPCLAFMWTPTGDSLVVARVDTSRNLLEWRRMDLDGWSEPIADMYPTRDLGFYLRFFEQYTQSHPLVDPTGTKLLLSGGLYGHGDPQGTSKIWEVPLTGGRPRELAEGVFAVYGPTPTSDDGAVSG